MFSKIPISRMFSVFLIVIFLLTVFLPVRAESHDSPHFVSGDFFWAKSMGGTSSDFANGITVDSSGNVYTTGSFSGTADFDPSAGTADLTSAGSGDVFVSKLDSSGAFLWAKSMGGTGYDEGRSIVIDSSGNIYTTGSFEGIADFDPSTGTADLISAGQADLFVSKLDSNGNFVWAERMGGATDDRGDSIALDSSSNVYTTGYFQLTADFDPGVGTVNLTSAGIYDIFVSKLDSNGNFVWARRMGGTDYDFGSSIALDSSSNVYTTGGYYSSIVDFDPGTGIVNLANAGNYDIFVSKLDSSGNFVWAKSMGGTGSETGSGIAVDSNGNAYTTGSYQGIVDFDPGAGIVNLTSAGNSDIFVSKLDSSGAFVWAKSMGGADDDFGDDIVLDSVGSVFTTGAYYSTNADFDPGAGIANLSSTGNRDIFVSKLDNTGNFLLAKSLGGAGYDSAYDIALDSSNGVYTTGRYSFTADFDPGVGTADLTSVGGYDIFISKLENRVYNIFLPLILR